MVLVNSFSKYFCMTGWRLGWLVLPAARVRDFEKLAQHFSICAPSAAQHAALAAFEPATLAGAGGAAPGVRSGGATSWCPRWSAPASSVPARPTGAFYVYADCSALGGDASASRWSMLEEAGVAATPGLDFGANGTQHCLRFAYTRSLAELEEAAARIARFCASRR